MTDHPHPITSSGDESPSPLVLPFRDLHAGLTRDLPPSHWIEIPQSRVSSFAECTLDRQWIHVDVTRAADGPFGSTVAHGFLTLSLLPALLDGSLQFQGVGMQVNYGLDRVRFTAPVLAGSRVRATGRLVVADADEASARVVVHAAIEILGANRPACVADWILKLYASDHDGTDQQDDHQGRNRTVPPSGGGREAVSPPGISVPDSMRKW